MRTDATPFVVGQIRRVSPALHGAQRRPPSRPPSTFQTVSERPSEKVFEQRFDYGFGQYTEAKMGRKSTLTGHRKGTLQTRPRLFGQSQKVYSRKPICRSANPYALGPERRAVARPNRRGEQ